MPALWPRGCEKSLGLLTWPKAYPLFLSFNSVHIHKVSMRDRIENQHIAIFDNVFPIHLRTLHPMAESDLMPHGVKCASATSTDNESMVTEISDSLPSWNQSSQTSLLSEDLSEAGYHAFEDVILWDFGSTRVKIVKTQKSSTSLLNYTTLYYTHFTTLGTTRIAGRTCGNQMIAWPRALELFKLLGAPS